MAKYAIITSDLQFAAANKHEERKKQVSTFLPHQIDILKKLRELNIPVIHMQLVNADDDPRAKDQPDELRFTRGSKGVQILKEVLEPTDIVLEKPKDSGFFETRLDDTLKTLGIDTVILTGMQTQVCINTTAADAHFRDYKVLIPSDCVVSTRPEDTINALKWLADYCATVAPSEEVINIVKNNTNETK